MNITSTIIGELLLNLLRSHNRVSLPGLGAFVAQHQSATFSDDGKQLLPPAKKIVFRTNEIWNDGYLEDALAAKGNALKEEVKKDLAVYVQKITTDLDNGKKVVFRGFGSLCKITDNNFQFDLVSTVNLLPESFGLLDIDVTPISQTFPTSPVSSATTTVKTEPVSAYTPPKPIDIMPPILNAYNTSNYNAPQSFTEMPFTDEKKKGGKAVWFILALALLIVAIIVLFIVFKEQITALYDQYYYTPAERELLKEYLSRQH